MIAVFTSFSISRGKIFSQKIQKFSICKNAVILFQTCKVFFRFSLKLTTVKVFYNVPQKKIASAWSSSTTCSNGFFSIHIPANKYVGLDFYLSFFFYFRTHFDFCSCSVCRLQRRRIFYLLQRASLLNIWIPVPSTKNIFWYDGPELKTHN